MFVLLIPYSYKDKAARIGENEVAFLAQVKIICKPVGKGYEFCE